MTTPAANNGHHVIKYPLDLWYPITKFNYRIYLTDNHTYLFWLYDNLHVMYMSVGI